MTAQLMKPQVREMRIGFVELIIPPAQKRYYIKKIFIIATTSMMNRDDARREAEESRHFVSVSLLGTILILWVAKCFRDFVVVVSEEQLLLLK